MPRYSVPLTAGQAVRLPYSGRVLQVVDTGAAASVSLEIEWNGDRQNVESFGEVLDFFKVKSETGPFQALSLTSTLDTTVDLLISNQDVTLSAFDNANVSATISSPLASGRVAVESQAKGINVTQTVITVTAASQAAVAANASRKYLAFMCVGSVDVTVTPDNPAVAGEGMVLDGTGVGMQGGAWTFDGAPPTDAFYVIAGGPGSKLIVWEGV